MTTSHEAPKKRQLPTVYTLLFIIIALMAALTWVLPAGKYNYVTAKTQQPVAAAAVADYSGGERLLPVPGSYTELPSRPQGVFEVLKAPIQGFHKAADVALFVLIIGGFLAVTMQSGALDAGVGAIVRTFAGRERLLIPVLIALFALGGTKQQEADYARLKGEYEAIGQAMIAKKCDQGTAPASAANAASARRNVPSRNIKA